MKPIGKREYVEAKLLIDDNGHCEERDVLFHCFGDISHGPGEKRIEVIFTVRRDENAGMFEVQYTLSERQTERMIAFLSASLATAQHIEMSLRAGEDLEAMRVAAKSESE